MSGSKLRTLLMSEQKIKEAREILKSLGLPPAQYNEMAALTLLALCQLKENDKWEKARNPSLGVTKGIMDFVNSHYQKNYAPNTRETFRRQVLHQFEQARIVNYNPDDPGLPVNSPRAHYAFTEEVLGLLQTYGKRGWKKQLSEWKKTIPTLSSIYKGKRSMEQIPVRLSNGKTIRLSAGLHNQVQAAIIHEFAARFAKGGSVLYLGDTANKDLYLDKEGLESIGIPITEHSKLLDVVIYDSGKNWLYLIEAVTSHGPVSPKRLLELEGFLNLCPAGKIYVTAFPDFSTFKKYSAQIAWDTEVWIMEMPDHMIHFNGDRFMGPR